MSAGQLKGKSNGGSFKTYGHEGLGMLGLWATNDWDGLTICPRTDIVFPVRDVSDPLLYPYTMNVSNCTRQLKLRKQI